MTLFLRADARIPRGVEGYPAAFARLGDAAPDELNACGSLALLRGPLVALFASVVVPGEAMLAAYDLARALRDDGVASVGGFQSPLERGCLALLLRGVQPVVVCPARSVQRMRAPSSWRAPIEQGRLLVLSAFPAPRRRPTASLAEARNRMVAALADGIVIVHAVPGGRLHRLAAEALAWKKRVLCPDLPCNRDLVVMGVEPVDPVSPSLCR